MAGEATPTTVNKTKFGASGVGDPVVFHPGLVGIKRSVDFGVLGAASGTAYELFALPKAFVATGAFIEETDFCTPGTIALKIADASDSSSDVTVLAATNVGGSTKARGAAQLSTAVVLNEGAHVYMAATATSGATFPKGKVNLVVYGYTPYGDGLEGVVTPDYRAVSQPETNVTGIDPWQETAVRRG